MKNDKFYVTMTDKFMSDWGKSKGRINKLIIRCDSYQQAERAKQIAESRDDMSYIRIRSSKPYYSPKKYLVQDETDSIERWENNALGNSLHTAVKLIKRDLNKA